MIGKDQLPDISVIISVYNNFVWLRLILEALRKQTEKDFEIIISDDGSSEATVAEIKKYITSHPDMKIIHAWQEDEGWRKNRSLNNAVRQSRGEYIIFIDGDCIPHPCFVADHKRLRKRGVVTGGRRVESGKALSEIVEGWAELPDDYFDRARKAIFHQIGKEKIGKVLSQLRRTIRYPFLFGKAIGLKNQGILGANFGLYREDLEKVNGFDERYVEPGTGEDTDLDVRLANAGIRHVKASHYALMIHRHHPRLVFGGKCNTDLLKSAEENHTTYVATGMYQTNKNVEDEK